MRTNFNKAARKFQFKKIAFGETKKRPSCRQGNPDASFPEHDIHEVPRSGMALATLTELTNRRSHNAGM